MFIQIHIITLWMNLMSKYKGRRRKIFKKRKGFSTFKGVDISPLFDLSGIERTIRTIVAESLGVPSAFFNLSRNV